MLFIISLLFAAAFSVLSEKALRRHPAPFYAAAAVLSITTTILANLRLPEIPAFVQQYILVLFTKGILAAAFWAVVMWTGALPNGSAAIKKLMPQRGQLSVFTAILSLGHAVGTGISVLPRWIRKADVTNLTVCLGLMLIMLPLTVISIQKIRRKMNAKSWKSVQRSAYLFYALIPIHVIVLNIAGARSGRSDVLLDLMLYLAVFLGYAVCRLNKWLRVKRKPGQMTGLNLASWCVFVIGMAVFAAAAFPQDRPPARENPPAVMREESPQSEAIGDDRFRKLSDTVERSGAADNPEPAGSAAPVRAYRDGTFTAAAYGYDGEITVHVTIRDDRITDIIAETEEDDDSYFADAKAVVIPAILLSQTAEVDACSGATYSSDGIMAAVRAALESAET